LPNKYLHLWKEVKNMTVTNMAQDDQQKRQRGDMDESGGNSGSSTGNR
jgi:hypothetical protein